MQDIDLIAPRQIEGWALWWPQRDQDDLVGEVADRIRAACARWDLELEHRFDEGWVCATWATIGADGARSVLKVAPPHSAMRREKALSERLGDLAIPVMASADDGMTLLLERADPGDPLSRVPVAEQISVCAGLAKRVASIPIPSELFPSWDVHHLGKLDDDLRAICAEMLLALAGSPPVLGHHDLHPGNVLRHRGGWRVIDGKGSVGPVELECLVVIEAAYAGHDPVDALERWALGLGTSTRSAWAGLACLCAYRLGTHDDAEYQHFLRDLLGLARDRVIR